MKAITIIKNNILMFFLLTFTILSHAAGAPLWTFTPLTATTLSVASNDTATVQYTVTNQTNRVHTLSIQSIPGVTQISTGLGICGNPFILPAKASCTLSLLVNGSQLTSPINDGPIACERGSSLQCYRPGPSDILHITQGAAITDATITVTGSPLTLTTNGSTGTLTINNSSLIVPATNITSDFTGTALDGNVTETGNTCASIAPQSSCTLTYTPGSTAVAQTSFSIQGTNTNAVTADMQIDQGITITTVSPSSGPASGGTGVTLIGTALTGATSVTFGGTAATSLNVIDSTTVTAVTPAHAVGAVDVVITTPDGDATKTEGFTYLTTAVGQSAYGGTIACLNGGLNNLIAATADNSTGLQWGAIGITTGATSITNGAANTATIVALLGPSSSYAAGLCDSYEVDSLGNSPCEPGNACYNDWFLPAGNNATDTGQLRCLCANSVAIGGFYNEFYWSSTEASSSQSWAHVFPNVTFQSSIFKAASSPHVRCVRAFTP